MRGGWNRAATAVDFAHVP